MEGRYHCSLAPVFGEQPAMDTIALDELQGSLELRVLGHSAGLLGFPHSILKRNADPVPAGTFVGLAEGSLVTAASGQVFRLSLAGGWSGLDATLIPLSEAPGAGTGSFGVRRRRQRSYDQGPILRRAASVLPPWA